MSEPSIFRQALKKIKPNYLLIQQLDELRLYQLSKDTYIKFDIFKKIVDLSKDSIRSQIHLIQKLDKYFPALGLIIGLIALSLQLLIILFDKQHSKATKITAGIIFLGLCGLAGAACALAVSAPILAGALGVAISFVTFLSDLYHFKLGFNRLALFKKRKEQIAKDVYEKEKAQKLLALQTQQKQLYQLLKQQLTMLLKASVENNTDAIKCATRQSRITLNSLIECDRNIQDITTEPKALSDKIHAESKSLTISAVSLSINVVSISLAISCLVVFGMVPWGFSALLLAVFIVDTIELCKNIQTKRNFNKARHKEEIATNHSADNYIDKAVSEISSENKLSSSYEKMISTMPTKKDELKQSAPTFSKKQSSSSLDTVERTDPSLDFSTNTVQLSHSL